MNIGGDESIGLPTGGTVGIDVDVRQFWFDLLGAYRVAHGAYDETGRRYPSTCRRASATTVCAKRSTPM